ncbi:MULTISPECIES: serine/threonine-protein kinase [unclassified Microcoleus]|uniref:serine/threonine-protein kinase n=1 Tax=unclassified Microcoleus TaxID=2642155 RepID=UPI002FD1F79C
MSLCVNPHCPNPKNADNVLRCSSCGSNLLLEGRYRVTHQLGEGGFAKTYHVSARGRLPKVLKVLIKNTPKAVELFKREAEVLSRFNILGILKGEEYFTFTPGNSQEQVVSTYTKLITHPTLLLFRRIKGFKSTQSAINFVYLLTTSSKALCGYSGKFAAALRS